MAECDMCNRQRLLNARERFLIIGQIPPMQVAPAAREQPAQQRRISNRLFKRLLEYRDGFTVAAA
jgi:hypothetical protein